MTAPTFTPLPAAPDLVEQPNAFTASTAAFVRALGPMVAEFNAAMAYMFKARLVLEDAEVSTSATAALITDDGGDWSVEVEAGKAYRFTVLGTYQTATATTGIKLSVAAVAAVGLISGYFKWAANNVAGAPSELTISALPADLTTASVNAGATSYHISATFIFACTTSGDIEIRWGTEVGGSAATLNAGAALLVEEI